MLKFLVPSFIKDLDKKLVLNYPFWYIVKLHYLVYFTAIMWVVSYLVGWLLPIDITSYNPMNVSNVWIFVFSVVAVILFCVWMYYLTIYNNEDHFGHYTIWDDTKLLVVLILGLNLLLSFSYPMLLCLKTRIGNTFDDATLARQYNALNMVNKYMTTNIDDFQYCGYDVHDTVSYDEARRDTNAYRNARYYHDLNKYKAFMSYRPDAENYSYAYHFFSFLTPKNDDSKAGEFNSSFLNAQQIENEYKSHTNDALKLKALSDYYAVATTYRDNFYPPGTVFNYTPQDYLDQYKHYEKTCLVYIPEAFNLKEEDKKRKMTELPFYIPTHYMNNIYEAKFSLPGILADGYLVFAFYFSFFISIFIILFRNNKWQHYLVSVVAFILLGIIIGIISLAISGSAFAGLSIFSWLVAGFISLNYYFKKDRYRITGAVASNLFYIGIPLMPYFICLYAHYSFNWLKCDYVNDYIQNQWECEVMNQQFNIIAMYAQIIGVLVFVFGVMPFYKSFFAKQKALPRDK